MAQKKWYFLYDSETKELIPGARYEEEAPENATTVEPNGFKGLPKWNESLKKWEGQSLDEWLDNQKSNTSQQVDQNQQLAKLAMKVMQLMQSNADLTARVKAFEAKEGHNV
ncbi:unnamed protein product [Fructobacillus evanidus]|uniref:Uncharacterized protein n=1 Tax=Fructobacillus evanidus TaxID=3064281 RepID=A0ABN9Z522_9LACO|nr:unnamed protein product [Fructobacillus sp. LMG 32999]CAK1248385.1 unnamed protein product [Fructobacillus sp. LMG 32999]CAK1249199.1 unnamed protein product [Fructobacillus sp. LMG 32999]CAK1254335.1 unnamed protein product [Fructobacillus sp. LMG 32999]CAK1255153.1 unnamed protein product [Fructobacillus sp. LMG 32999]